MATKLTKYERETIILFNEGESTASVYTHNRKWQKHIESRFKIQPTEQDSYGGRTYILPKDRIRLPMPKRKLTKTSLTNLPHLRRVKNQIKVIS